MTERLDRWLPYLVLAAAFVLALAFRPLLPVDETRYLTVAWEMRLRGDFLLPTVNFQPYFQKPPLLFWLIDLSWAMLGVSRAAALVPAFAAAACTVELTRLLALALFPGRHDIAGRIRWLAVGNTAFLIYSSWILFDILLTACALAAVLALMAFARGGGLRFAALAGLFLGLGVLTKGPVVVLHAAWPVLLYPLWRDPARDLAPGRFFAGLPLVLAAALLPVALWLGPLLIRTGSDVFVGLVWKQSAGRISGQLEAAHARPFFFFLPLLPLLFLPWALSPFLWRAAPFRRIRELAGGPPAEARSLRLLFGWIVGVVLVFSLISGKQPHYLVPVIAPITVALGCFLCQTPVRVLRAGAAISLALIAAASVVSVWAVFPQYDLGRVAAMMRNKPEAEWGFTGRYQGELNFLARAEKPLAVFANADAAAPWLAAAPNRFLIVPGRKPPRPGADLVYTQPYRWGFLAVRKGAGRSP